MNRDNQRFPGPIGYLSSESITYKIFLEPNLFLMNFTIVGNFEVSNAAGEDDTESDDSSWQKRKV